MESEWQNQFTQFIALKYDNYGAVIIKSCICTREVIIHKMQKT